MNDDRSKTVVWPSYRQDDPYKILGISPEEATSERIKDVFSEAALQTHQTCQASSQRECREAAQQFARINNAYQLLSDPRRKEQYDYKHDNQLKDSNDIHRMLDRELSLRRDVEDDPFRRDLFSSRRSDPFDDRQFFGGGGIFGGMLDELQRMQQEQEQGGNKDGSSNNRMFFSSKNSTSYQNKDGEQVTEVTTSRRGADGKSETVKERIIRKRDGTVERQTVTDDNNSSQSFPKIQMQRPSDVWRRRQEERQRVQQQKPKKELSHRGFGMTPEQRAALEDDDEEDNRKFPNVPTQQSDDKSTSKKKSSWFW